MHAQTEKTTFSCKDDKSKTLHLYWSGARDLFIYEAHTVLDIFCFAVFFPCMLPSPCRSLLVASLLALVALFHWRGNISNDN